METTEVNPKNWKSLIKPPKLDIQLSDDKSYAKIIAEPLEKGYGLTLGNSLRRILLSSIRGTAVTALQIAVACAMALNNQEIVLNKVKSLNETTSKLIKHNAERLKTQGVEIHKQAAEATLKMEDLENG